jgi:hypothetical protein
VDFTRLNRGERIAGLAGALLIVIMFIFKWFGAEAVSRSGEIEGVNAWGAYGFTDVVLFVTGLAAIGLALAAAWEAEVGLPVALSAIVTALGIISLILVVVSLVSPPSFLPASDSGVDYTRKIGAWLGLVATAAVTVGGYLGMQEEGTSFADQADRLRDGGTGGPTSEPPQPPPSGGP